MRTSLASVGKSAAQAESARLQTHLERGPEVLFWPNCFWDAWGNKATEEHAFRIIVVFDLAAFGGEVTQTLFS